MGQFRFLYMGRIMMKLLDIPGKVWAVPLRDGIGLFFLGINQAMIQTVRTGRNPTMRYLGQVHKIAVARLHEQWVALTLATPRWIAFH